MNNRIAALSGASIGVTLMYLFDPQRGARRRAGAKDKVVHGIHQGEHAIEIASRDLAHRAVGYLAEAKASLRTKKVTDEVLIDRIRSKLGRFVAHPHSIEVGAHDGIVVLTGVLSSDELDPLLKCVSKIPGVKRIEDRLEPHKHKGHIPGLQGAGRRPMGQRIDVLQTNWAPATRLIMAMAGGGLILYGMRSSFEKRHPILGFLANTIGLGFIARAVTNREWSALLGAPRPSISIHKTMNVISPVENVFRFWSNFENFPKVLTDVREVRVGANGQSHWIIEGPARVPIAWEAVMTRLVPNELLAWRSVPGSVIENSGRIRFSPSGDHGTRIDLDFSYRPPVGALGNLAAKIFGSAPKSRIDEALAQVKTLLEHGPSERQKIGLH